LNLDGFNPPVKTNQDNFILITQSEAKDVDEDKILFETDDPEMARRMCACLNECKGISTEDLENGIVRKAMKQYNRKI